MENRALRLAGSLRSFTASKARRNPKAAIVVEHGLGLRYQPLEVGVGGALIGPFPLAFGLVPLGERDAGGDQSDNHKQGEAAGNTPCNTQRSTVLANVFTFELVFGDTVDGGRQVCYR